MILRTRLSSATLFAALGSVVSLGAQGLFAVFLLKLFDASAVGQFSVVSQIAFGWATLALAQSPLSLLADRHIAAQTAAATAWGQSAVRMLWMSPWALLALWWSQSHATAGATNWSALAPWACGIAGLQMSWLLAQSLTLRVGSTWQQAAVRVLPPAAAATTALTAALIGASVGWSGPTLILSALLGYAVGAAWLVPALRMRDVPQDHTSSASIASTLDPAQATHAQQSDPRSATLRMAHTLVDALLATAIIVVWQRLYGAEETGWMSALLRVLGFLPAVVHMAWAQVALARGTRGSPAQTWANPWWLGLGAFACVIVLGLSCALALYQECLDLRWHGVLPYIAPLVLWQGAACLSAAFSHRPFQTQSASTYSWACMALGVLQTLVLLAPLGLAQPIQAAQHMAAFAFFSGGGLLAMTLWMARLKSRNI